MGTPYDNLWKLMGIFYNKVLQNELLELIFLYPSKQNMNLLKYDIEIISAPSILGLQPNGVEKLAES